MDREKRIEDLFEFVEFVTDRFFNNYGYTDAEWKEWIARMAPRARAACERLLAGEGERFIQAAIAHLPKDVADRVTNGDPDSKEGQEIQDDVRDACHFGLRAFLASRPEPCECKAEWIEEAHCVRCGAEFESAPEPEEPAENVKEHFCAASLRQADAARELIDALIQPDAGVLSRAWEEACFQWGRHDSPYLLFSPVPFRIDAEPAESKGKPERLFAKHQPCGCVVCTCEDDEKCQGCGAHWCGTHPVPEIPIPVYAGGAAKAVVNIAVERLRADLAHLRENTDDDEHCFTCGYDKACDCYPDRRDA